MISLPPHSCTKTEKRAILPLESEHSETLLKFLFTTCVAYSRFSLCVCVMAHMVVTQRHSPIAQLLCSQLKWVVISSTFSLHNRRHLCWCDIVHPLWFQNEIFASRHQDENSVACIEDRCYVLPLAQYCRWVQSHTHTHRTQIHFSDSRLLEFFLKGFGGF